MISHKFDERMGGWCSCEERKGYGVGLWKERQAKFQARNSFEVCNGRTVGELDLHPFFLVLHPFKAYQKKKGPLES